ncbi:MAG: AGE family epimerase/isomerase [Bacillota bacterium]
MYTDKLKSFYCTLEKELNNILKFWIDNIIDEENGGFYGYISNNMTIDKKHDKSSVLYSRILWTFSTAYRIYKDEKYLFMANRAYNFILDHFIDSEFKGVYWMLGCKGNVVNSKKQVYAIAFTIYGLSEYYRATGNKESLYIAVELFRTLEKHAYDNELKGYIEAFARDWSPTEDMSLSNKDENAMKTLNTHLHVMEAYTNLLRVWNNSELKYRLRELVDVTIEHIIDKENCCFNLYFDKSWNPLSQSTSFGHDIEGSWLLREAAEVLGDKEVLVQVNDMAVKMAQTVYDKGIDRKYGGICNEAEHGIITDSCKDWWAQAESIVGFFNAFQLTGKDYFLNASFDVWEFIDRFIVDKEKGEWFWGVSADGKKITRSDKVGPWKCPYHNSRMCFEMLERLKSLK